MTSDDMLHRTLQGLSAHGMWAEMIEFAMAHAVVCRRERPLLHLLTEAFCQEIPHVNAERAVELDHLFRSLGLSWESPFAQRWWGCRNKALGKTPYAYWMARGNEALSRKEGHAALDCFAEVMKLDPYSPQGFHGQEQAMALVFRDARRSRSKAGVDADSTFRLLEEWLPHLSKPSPAFSAAMDLFSSGRDGFTLPVCKDFPPVDWPVPFWRIQDTRPSRRHPWSLLGHQLRVVDRQVAGLLASLRTDEEDPVLALPDQGQSLLEWAHDLAPHIPRKSPAWLRLSDFHRNWGSQEYADKLLFRYMKRKPGCPLAWLHLAVSFYYPHKTSLYFSGLCKAALLLQPEHPLYVRTHLFLAKEYHDRKQPDLARQEYRVAKGGKTRVPLERLSFRLRLLLGSLEDGVAEIIDGHEARERYQAGAIEAETYAQNEMG